MGQADACHTSFLGQRLPRLPLSRLGLPPSLAKVVRVIMKPKTRHSSPSAVVLALARSSSSRKITLAQHMGAKVLSLPSQRRAIPDALLTSLQNDDSEFAIRPTLWHQASKWCRLAEQFKQRAANPRTLSADNSAYNRYWVPFCGMLRTPTIRRIKGVMGPTHPDWDRERMLFAWFLMFVFERIKPRRRSDAAAKPASVLAVLLAIKREHRRMGLDHCIPSHKSIATIVRGMTLAFAEEYGTEALLPSRKEPIPTCVIRRLMTIPEGTVLSPTRSMQRDSFEGRSIAVAVGYAKTTGGRKADLTRCASSPTCVMRGHLVWFAGRDDEDSEEFVEPTLRDLHMLLTTTRVVTAGIAAPPSKTDPTNERYGNFLCYSTLRHDEGNAAFQYLKMEIAFPVQRREDRMRIPLVGPAFGEAFSSGQLDGIFKAMMQTVAALHPTELYVAWLDRYSWHSFRISLACRLRPHCDDSTIQTLCRWATPTSMKLYARLGRSQYSSLLDRAETVDLDAVQAATLWRSCPHIDDDHHFEFAADLATHLAGEGGTRSQPPGRDENITA